jgi:hypothetical protein
MSYYIEISSVQLSNKQQHERVTEEQKQKKIDKGISQMNECRHLEQTHGA